MESNNYNLHNLNRDRFVDAVYTVQLREKAGQSLRQMIEVNPELVELADSFVDTSPEGSTPEAAETYREGYLRSLLVFKEYSQSAESVLLSDRATYLSQILRSRSMRIIRMHEGFEEASSEESRHFPELKERYHDGLKIVESRVQAKHLRLLNQVKRQFANGIGHYAVIRSGSIDPKRARLMATKDFEAFKEKYFVSDQAKINRKELLEQLKGHIKT